jgi:hypothetical protein
MGILTLFVLQDRWVAGDGVSILSIEARGWDDFRLADSPTAEPRFNRKSKIGNRQSAHPLNTLIGTRRGMGILTMG